MKIINFILRLILGGLFIFSGVVKLIDPKGTQIKLEEYFTAFGRLGEHYIGDFVGSFFQALIPTGLFLSVGLSALEVILGIAIILWVRPKLTLWTTFVLLIFFGLLTGYSSSCDPNNEIGVSCVTDCGCFGDFLKLKPIESFYKDLILLVISLPLLLMAIKKLVPESINRTNTLIVYLTAGLAFLFGIMNIVNLPIIDFRPYEVGNNLTQLRTDGEPAKVAYIMTKDGKEETFDEYPHEGGYTFVKVNEVAPATEPTAKDFYLYNEQNGDDITEQVLENGVSFIVIKDINDLSADEIKNVNETIAILAKTGKGAIITGNSFEHIRNNLNTTDNTALYNIDETVIKAMVRNYPSFINIEKGVVVSKEEIDQSLIEKLK